MSDLWTILILLLAGILAWKLLTSSKEGYVATTTSTRPPALSAFSTSRPGCAPPTNLPSYATLQTQAENQLTEVLQSQQTLSPQDLIPQSTSSECGAKNATDLHTDLANYSAALGVARVGVVSIGVPKRYMSLDLRGGEKIPTCSNLSPWNMSAIGPDDIPETKPLC